jgi:hypothetical protein
MDSSVGRSLTVHYRTAEVRRKSPLTIQNLRRNAR